MRYVQRTADLKNPDMVILPGTKNTMEDLLWMRQNGLEAAILKLAGAGTAVFGICGGYQMLGETLRDPEGVEAGGWIRGMGLLPMDTVFTPEKTRTRVEGAFETLEGLFSGLSGVRLEGYEIHMGVTALKEGCPHALRIRDQVRAEGDKQDGAVLGAVLGTYVHGIFDKEEVAKGVVTALARKKGIDPTKISGVDFQTFKETQYDLLADGLRRHLDMKKIYEILDQGV